MEWIEMGGHDSFCGRICVIIPVYNAKNYLKKAVISVLNQRYKKIKIILVNDGSTDGSSDLCDELACRYAAVTALHQENGGVSAARNYGIEYVLTSGGNSYITFLDADDAWMDDFFDVNIEQLIDRKYDLIGFQSCMCNQQFTKRDEPRYLKEGEHKGGASAVWIHATQSFGAMLYSCELIKKYNLRFQVGLQYTEDKIFSMQCLYLADRIYLENQLMYLYRQNEASAVHQRKKGISYYVPIIDAYIKSDADMAMWKNKARGVLNEGKLLAKIYIMDMAEEEYESWNGIRRIRKLIEEKSDYREIAERITGSAPVDERWLYMQNHEQKIAIKNWIFGIAHKIMRSIYYLPFVRKYADRKRYPIEV